MLHFPIFFMIFYKYFYFIFLQKKERLNTNLKIEFQKKFLIKQGRAMWSEEYGK